VWSVCRSGSHRRHPNSLGVASMAVLGKENSAMLEETWLVKVGGPVKNFNELRMKSKSRVVMAQGFRRAINQLKSQQDKIYRQALKSLKVADTSITFDYFFNQPNEGFSSFEQFLEVK